MSDTDVRRLFNALQHRSRDHADDLLQAVQVIQALLQDWSPNPDRPQATRTGRRARRLLAAWRRRLLPRPNPSPR